MPPYASKSQVDLFNPTTSLHRGVVDDIRKPITLMLQKMVQSVFLMYGVD
jgi:hypothetical protein